MPLGTGGYYLSAAEQYALGATPGGGTAPVDPPPPGSLVLPAGPQPTVWLMPNGSQTLADYRGGGYNTITGLLPLVNSYAGKSAWQYDGSTQIRIDGHGLNLSNKMTLLYQISSADYNSQHYLSTHGSGTNPPGGPSRFDIYSQMSQAIMRTKAADSSLSQCAVAMNPLSQPTNLLFFVNYSQNPVVRTLSDSNNYDSAAPGQSDTGPLHDTPYVNEPLFLFSGGYNGAIPFAAGSRIRAFLVWNQELTTQKAREWLNYLDTLP